MAGIDIGTNTVRLLVSDVIDNAIIDVARRSEVVGLGRGLDETGRISDEALSTLGATLREFAVVLEVAKPDLLRVIATAAARDASNADDLSDLVRSAVGAPPHIVSGEDEAALSFAGARWGTTERGPILVVDPGGGSTEFVFGDESVDYATSIDIGSIRLTDRFLPDRPASDLSVEAARRHAAASFGEIALPGQPATVVGVAGTFRTLASVHLDLGYYDRNLTHGVVLSQDALDELVDRFAGLSIEDTEAMASIPPGRAPVILGGSIVAAEALRSSGVGSITVSKTGILQGIVLDLASSA